MIVLIVPLSPDFDSKIELDQMKDFIFAYLLEESVLVNSGGWLFLSFRLLLSSGQSYDDVKV